MRSRGDVERRLEARAEAAAPSIAEGDGYVIDSGAVGALYESPARVLVDPYSKMDQNVVRVRTEYRALCVVRSVGAITKVSLSVGGSGS